MARALDANISARAAWPAEPDRDARGFRIRNALVTFRFAELLTRPPIPRHIQSSSWGTGSSSVRALAGPAPAHAHDPCVSPTAPRYPPGSKPWQVRRLPMSTALGLLRPPRDRSPWVQARAGLEPAPCPHLLASPSLRLSVPIESNPPRLRRVPHAPSPGPFPTSSCGSALDSGNSRSSARSPPVGC